MCLHNAEVLAKPARPSRSLFGSSTAEEEEEGSFKWDMVILDEGHKVGGWGFSGQVWQAMMNCHVREYWARVRIVNQGKGH
jgi:hypothetical protein